VTCIHSIDSTIKIHNFFDNAANNQLLTVYSYITRVREKLISYQSTRNISHTLQFAIENYFRKINVQQLLEELTFLATK